jgi:uncharacterized membrane protein
VSERLWEVDVVRTIAILMMVAYHIGYDANLVGPGVDIDPLSGGWLALQVATGSSFLFIVGVSLWISNARGRARGLSGWALYLRHARRAGEVLLGALLVSLVTFIALGDDYVRFGILHCIAVAMLILPLLVRLAPPLLLVLGVAVIAAGIALVHDGPRSDAIGLLALGFRRTGTEGVDWYPLLPWLGPAILGLAAGAVLYPDGRRGRWGRRLPTPSHARALGWPGRHALPIYLVHQIVLIALVAGALALAGAEVSLDKIH